MKTIEEYKALSEELAAELERTQIELESIRGNRDKSFTLIGTGTVYGDQEMITQIERKFGIKPHLKLVE